MYWLYLLIASLLVMAGAAKRRSKGRSRLAVINVNETITLGALASGVVVATNTDQFEREFYAISADIYWNLRSATAGEGPLEVGLAHGDYTVTEVKEKLDLTGMEDPSDKISWERGRRLVRRSAKFNYLAAAEIINDGKAIRTPIRMMLAGSVATVQFWAHNLSAAPLTTGGVVQVSGKIYGRWV